MLTYIHHHSDEDDKSKDIVECRHKENNGYDYINDGWQDLKYNSAEIDNKQTTIEVVPFIPLQHLVK